MLSIVYAFKLKFIVYEFRVIEAHRTGTMGLSFRSHILSPSGIYHRNFARSIQPCILVISHRWLQILVTASCVVLEPFDWSEYILNLYLPAEIWCNSPEHFDHFTFASIICQSVCVPVSILTVAHIRCSKCKSFHRISKLHAANFEHEYLQQNQFHLNFLLI